MSRNVKVVLNYEGVGQLLKSSEMQAYLGYLAQPIADFTKGKLEVYVAQTRAVARVGGDDGNNSLLKGINP